MSYRLLIHPLKKIPKTIIDLFLISAKQGICFYLLTTNLSTLVKHSFTNVDFARMIVP